jgi:hypothetical protein
LVDDYLANRRAQGLSRKTSAATHMLLWPTRWSVAETGASSVERLTAIN